MIRLSGVFFRFSMLVAALLVAGGVSGAAVAQTGPGGVGNSDGSTASGVSQPQNALWLRADEGVTTDGSGGVTDWADQSGNGNDANSRLDSPLLESSFGNFGGAPALKFSSGTRQMMEVTENSDLDNTDEITIFSVVQIDKLDSNARGILGKRADFEDKQSYTQFLFQDDKFRFYAGSDADYRVDNTNISEGGQYILQNWYSRSPSDELRAYVNGGNLTTATSSNTDDPRIQDFSSTLRIGILATGGEVTASESTDRFFEGRIGEIVIYRTALNEAQRTIVNSYLADKYSVGVSGEAFSYDNGSFSDDVAGIGRAPNSDEHQFAKSDLLGFGAAGAANSGDFNARGFGTDDQFIFLGHNGLGTTAFVEPINGLTADAKRLGRTWRADFKGSGFGASATKSVTIQVDASELPSQPDPGDDSYFVLVDGSSADFDSGSLEAYELTGSGTLTTTVDLEDGDHVTIGAGRRTVNFTAATGSGFENTASPSVTARLNLPYTTSGKTEVSGTGTTVDVTIGEEGDLDGSGSIEDGGVTNDPGSNGNGDFEADDGDGSDDGSGPEDNFEGDYRLDTGFSNPLSISAGGEEATVSLELDDDGFQEQTEKFAVTIDGVTNAVEGGGRRFVFSINDDDEVRDLTFVDGDDGNSKDEDNTSTPETFTVTLDQDGTGTDPAIASPYTSVEFAVDEANTDATPGTDLSDPTVDFKIVDESGSGGDEFQERLSPTRGRLNFADGQGSNPDPEDAELKLEINQDNVDDVEAEDIVLKLENPQSAKLSQDTDIQPSPNLDLKFTINDDENPPRVQFAQSSSAGGESTDGTVAVALSNPEGGPDVSGDTVTVDFSVDAANSSATEGASDDFTTSPSNDTLQFLPGTNSRSIAVDVRDDNLDEVDETVQIDLDGSGNETTPPTLGAQLGGTTSHTYTIRDNDTPAIGSTGPGGVGDAETGTGRLKLWLRADAIVDSIATDGDPLSTWPDTSGNGNDASADTAPTYQSSVTAANGRPMVRFDGTDGTRMTGTFTIEGDAEYFTVANGESGAAAGGPGVVFEGASVSNPGGEDTRNILGLPGDELYFYYNSAGQIFRGNTNVGNPKSGFVIYGAESIGNIARIRKNGSQVGSDITSEDGGTPDPNGTLTDYAVGDDLTSGNEIDGDIGEIISFSGTLTEVQRTLIQNYLSAKYDIGLASGDRYAGDTGGNGDYDRGVFGVGQASGGSLHSAAETGGLRFSVSQGLESGDYLLAGHRTATNAVTTSDIGGVGGALEARSERAWYVDRTDGGTAITVDVTVDLSEAGLAGPAGTADDYVLLERPANTTNDWSAVQNGADAVNGDEITFNGITPTDANEITLGTTDAADSPLVTNELIITGNTGGADGKDQGWRYLGLPVTGATAGDLQRGSGATFIDFGVSMAYTNPGGDVQGSGTGWTAVSDPSTALTNGRGFILWLYDDQNYPLDPSITLKTAPGLTSPGEADVTVGDNTPSGDDPTLSQSNKQFLLANPYAVPFELRNLYNTAAGGVGDGGFDSVVQIWEADATKSGNDVSGQDDENVGSFVTRSRSSGDEIAAWQGFLLTRTSTGSGDEQITFSSSGRAPAASPSLVGSKSRPDEPTQRRVPLRLVGRDNDGSIVALDRAASVLFHEEATAGRDYLDSPKFEPMQGSYAALAPVAASSDTVLRAQESRPLPKGDTVTVPLDFQAEGVSGTFEVRVPDGGAASTETPSIPDGWEVALVDTKGTATSDDDTTHPLTPGGTPYTFEVETAKAAPGAKAASASTSSKDRGAPPPELRRLTLSSSEAAGAKAASDDPTRFVLEVRPEWDDPTDDGGPTDEEDSDGAPATTLQNTPVKARQDGDRAILTWNFPSKPGDVDVEVQHQRHPADGTNANLSSSEWDTLDDVKTSKKSQSYQYKTAPLDYGRHFFRLKQKGGDTATTPVEVQMRLDGAYAVGGPYPNPSSQTATLPVTVRKTQEVTVSLYDLMGRRIRTAYRREIQGQKTKPIPLSVDGLASGVYFVRVRGDEFATTRRLTVVR
jgi:hypothetical protein